MTLEEAKKILEKEGFVVERFLGVLVEDVKTASWEKIEVSEAMRVVAENGYLALMEESKYKERKARLKKECENNTKAPVFSEVEAGDGYLKKATDAFILQANEIMRLKKKNAELLEAIDKMKEGNPALKEASSQFNDALLDEQAKKIERLKKETAELLGIVERMKQDVKEVDYKFNAACKENERLNEKIRELINEKTNLEDQITILNACKKHNDKIDRKQIKRLGKEISKLNGIIRKKNLKIEELGKESFRHLSGKVKMFGENVDLEQMLKDKNAVLADVAEELRLSKIREKNLVEVSQKYMKENEELKKKLADKVVDKIDAQALNSAESALAYKEKVIAEKDEVIADLTHELKAKHKKYVWYKGAYDAAQQILNTIADYAAKHPDKKFSDQMVEENHPIEGDPEEIEIEKAVKIVRKAMKDGHTVTIDYKD